MKIYQSLIGLIFSLLPVMILAQDPISSQFSIGKSLLNPAYTGEQGKGLSAGTSFRNQWTYAGLPYRSNSLRIARGGKRIDIGVNMVQEKSGPANLSNLSLGLALAWHWDFNQTEIALGWQAGIAQKSINQQLLTFDNQYVNGVGYDAGIDSNEYMPDASIQVADIGVGASLIHHFGAERMLDRLQLGIGVGHASQPSFSFLGGEAFLARRIAIDATLWTRKTGGRSWVGRLLWVRQGDARQTHIQAGMHQQIDPNMAVELGVGHRLEDAVIPYLRVDIDAWKLGLSYDFTTSGLRSATQFRGGLELQLAYRFNKKKKATIVDEQPETIAIVETIKETPKPSAASSLDQDGDGLADIIDHCPLCPGSVENHGCPAPVASAAPSPCNCTNNAPIRSAELPDFGLVLFKTNLSTIEAEFRASLNELTVFMLTHPETGLQVAGHTDMEGNATYNYTLGESRAQAVKDYLVKKGIAPFRVNIISFGETQPVAQNQTTEGKRLNRRAKPMLFRMK
ncbi:MAG: PorP/SprF family type IX secretion system membrane protein [Bacteroidia bacterium]